MCMFLAWSWKCVLLFKDVHRGHPTGGLNPWTWCCFCPCNEHWFCYRYCTVLAIFSDSNAAWRLWSVYSLRFCGFKRILLVSSSFSPFYLLLFCNFFALCEHLYTHVSQEQSDPASHRRLKLMSKWSLLFLWYPSSVGDLPQDWKSAVVLSVLCRASVTNTAYLLLIRTGEETVLYVLGNRFCKLHVVSL